MEQEREHLRQEIADTRRSILNRMDEIAQNTLDGVQNVSDGVLETARTVEQGVRKLSLHHQVQERPLVCVGVAVAAGYLTGRRLASKRARSLPTAGTSRPSPEPGVVARVGSAVLPVALGFGASLLGEWAKRKYPQSEPYISLAEGAFLNRLP